MNKFLAVVLVVGGFIMFGASTQSLWLNMVGLGMMVVGIIGKARNMQRNPLD
jgi:hypothetical protein